MTGRLHVENRAERGITRLRCSLKSVRTLSAGSEYAAEIDQFIAEVRAANRWWPCLQHHFDRAGVP